MRKREAFTGIFARHFNRNGASHGEAQSSESCGKSNFACVSGYNVSVSAKRLQAFSRGISTETAHRTARRKAAKAAAKVILPAFPVIM